MRTSGGDENAMVAVAAVVVPREQHEKQVEEGGRKPAALRSSLFSSASNSLASHKGFVAAGSPSS